MPDAVSYTLRLSTTTSFRAIVKQAKVTTTNADIIGLDPGEYFWNVTAQDAKKQSSEVSDNFQVHPRGPGQVPGHDPGN